MCLFVGGAGLGFHTMFLLCLVSVFLYLAALCTFGFSCAVRPFGALPRILNILVHHSIVSPWFVALPYNESLCVFAGGAGWGFIPCFSLLLSPSSCTLRSCVCVCVCAWSVPLAPLIRILNILARHTIVSPWFVGIAYSESVCTLCGWGGGGVSYHVSL